MSGRHDEHPKRFAMPEPCPKTARPSPSIALGVGESRGIAGRSASPNPLLPFPRFFLTSALNIVFALIRPPLIRFKLALYMTAMYFCGAAAILYTMSRNFDAIGK